MANDAAFSHCFKLVRKNFSGMPPLECGRKQEGRIPAAARYQIRGFIEISSFSSTKLRMDLAGKKIVAAGCRRELKIRSVGNDLTRRYQCCHWYTPDVWQEVFTRSSEKGRKELESTLRCRQKLCVRRVSNIWTPRYSHKECSRFYGESSNLPHPQTVTKVKNLCNSTWAIHPGRRLSSLVTIGKNLEEELTCKRHTGSGHTDIKTAASCHSTRADFMFTRRDLETYFVGPQY